MNKHRLYIFLVLAIALINAIILFAFFVSRFEHPDSDEYAATIDYFLNRNEKRIYIYRLIKPAPILSSIPLALIFESKKAIMIENLIFYLLSVWLLFRIIFYLYKSERQALYGSILYSTAYPMLAYGLAPLTDISGWFFYILTIWLSINFLQKPSTKKAFTIGLIAGTGMLFKENAAAIPLFFASFALIGLEKSLQDKMKYCFLFATGFFIPVILNTIILYRIFSYSYLDWYISNWSGHTGAWPYAYSPIRTIVEIGRVFMLGWLFVFMGIKKEKHYISIQRKKILYALILPSLSFFLWAYPHNRMAFIAAPLLAILGSHGVIQNFNNRKKNIIELGSLVVYIIFNYIMLDIILNYGNLIKQEFSL